MGHKRIKNIWNQYARLIQLETIFRMFIMSHWNYRVIKKYHKETDTSTYHIHEVYYSDDGIIESWTESAVEPMGETVDELREDIRFFTKAFQKPVLKEETENGKPALVPQNDLQEINDGHYFELMDRAGVAVDYIYQFLGCHPIIIKDGNLREIYERAGNALVELYQEAGRLEFEQTNKNDNP
ncbi:MAG: hypothetical protein SCABRO_00472 [Candidatus Scalindua brodae]|uniref:Uncharacterized protein n=1 Tax=Candidatus Scalindua brodae TaxID=237368 RepID=A0A0B0EMA9_9BACT|nr:MAG: hypothetical protein SCABRO_00472 [Candidatus Scalindua brodae]